MWYSEITNSLVRQHGVIAYCFGMPATVFDVDGLSCIALATSPNYSVKAGLTESVAMKALEVIGRIGISSPTIKWELIEVPSDVTKPPNFVWNDLLEGVKSKPATYLGMGYAMLVSYAIQLVKLSNSEKGSDEASEDRIPTLALARRALGAEPIKNYPLSIRLQELIAQGYFNPQKA